MLPNDDKVILYVDDETAALKYFGQLFEDQFRIRTAASGEEAWEFIESRPEQVAVLVTDQRMAPVSGVELMDRVRTRYPNIVRILVTAFTQLDYAVKSVNEGGAFRYLTKPINDEEMVGTLLRACEFHEMMVDRDRLIQEKLSVLHRLVIMDRVRGLSTAVTALSGQLRSAWPAFLSYIEQAPLTSCLSVQLDEIAELNLLAVARRESRQMIETVRTILLETIHNASGEDTEVNVGALVENVIADRGKQLAQDDIGIEYHDDATSTIRSDAKLICQLTTVLLRRLSDIQDQPSTIGVKVSDRDSGVVIEMRGFFRSLDEGQVASFFSAAIPIRKWPIGLDMDLLSSFLIVHHLGGKIRVEAEPPTGPGFRVFLPVTNEGVDDVPLPEVSDEWFEQVHRSLNEWEQQIEEHV